MYLAGLKKLRSLGLNAQAMAFYNSGQWTGADPIECEARGGTVSVRYSSYGAYGMPNPPASFSCTLPATAAPSASGNVTVNTTTQSTVSPQISPNLVQQQSPSNSPVNAGTSQVSPAPQSSSQGASADYAAFLDEQQQREKSFMDTIASMMAPAASSPVPAAPAPIYSDAGMPIEPAQAATGAVAVPSKLAQYTPWIVFATAVLALGAALRHRKK